MANGRTGRASRTDYWAVYDALPAPIRAALQEGPQPWSALWARSQMRDYGKRLTREQAIAAVVRDIHEWHRWEIGDAKPWQPKREPFKKAPPKVASPHLRAQATMQLSGR